MKALAAYIMRGRTQAISIAAGFAVLSLILPLINVACGAVIALVALRQGPSAGMLLVVTSSLIPALLMLATGGMTFPMPAIVLMLLVMFLLLTWLVSVVLRYTRSLPMAISVLTPVAMVIFVWFHLAVGDPLAWWQANFGEFFKQFTQAVMGSQDMISQENLETLATIITGFVTTFFLLEIVLALFIARAWQAMLYNPGGFRQEFHSLQFGKKYAVFALVVASVALIPNSTIGLICKDILVVIMMVYVLQGIAVVHSIVAQKGLHWAWLAGLYVLVVTISQLVAITGYIDTWMDFRKRFNKPG
jgi:hypothetical protein